MGSLSITTAQRVSEAIKRLGACGAVIRETGLAATSLDRYVRFCKECNLLPDGIRLIGDRYFDGDEPVVSIVASAGIESLISNTIKRSGYMDVPKVEPPTYRRGPHVSIDIGDLHRTDEDFMWLCYNDVIEKMVSDVRELNPGHVTVNIFGDWITGTGIFPGQAARNLTNHPHWQVIAGAYMIFELFSLLMDATGLRAEMNYILGNHDILNDRSGGVKTNLGYFLCNEVMATYGIPIQYRGTEAIIDYGEETNKHIALCVHGFGASNFTPHPNSLQQKMKDKTLNLNSIRAKEELITEVRHGHTHWIDTGTEITRTLTFRSCGGFQRNKRAELGQVQRSAGILLTIAGGADYVVKKIQPSNDIFEAEINSLDLEIKNVRRLGELLEVALGARITRMDCN